MDFIKCIDNSASGMSAQRTRLNVISMNLANANTTRTENGTPYRRQVAILETDSDSDSFQNTLEASILGVKVSGIVPVKGEFKKIFDPSHPDADEKGFVLMPNVNLVEEMVQMLNANRSFEANASAIKSAKDMALKAIEIGR